VVLGNGTAGEALCALWPEEICEWLKLDCQVDLGARGK
jgi:hypothetical protein